MTTLHIRQDAPHDGHYPIRLTLKQSDQPDRDAAANIQFALTVQEHEDLRWYLEDYLQRGDIAESVIAEQVETLMKTRGEELYTKVFAANANTQALWFSIRNDLANLRVELTTGVAEAASIPWELMRDPETGSPISLRVKSFVRVQSNPNISFVPTPPAHGGRIRLLYIACRPGGAKDVELRAVANRLLQDLGEGHSRFDFKALRPPTFQQLQQELTDAKESARPYHIVHFDGHGIYADLSKSSLGAWLTSLSTVTLGSESSGKHGYLLFEHDSEDKMRPVDGHQLGQLLHDSGVPLLVLNACQSAMHDATTTHVKAAGLHDEVRAIGSLAQAVIDQGIPAVLGMRYSVYVVTAAQYIGQLYAALAKGRSFGQAATEGRKHLQLNPERWVGLQPRPLQDWFVPVAYEASPIVLTGQKAGLDEQPELDPVQLNRSLLRHVPDEGFIGRDETLLALDRAFDNHRVVLLHAYAGQGKSSTAVEFARWYCVTGGLGEQPVVLLASFESHTDLDDLLNQIGQPFARLLEAKGILWSAVNDPNQRRQLVIQLLREVPILWIWDNVEPVAGFPEGTESSWTESEQNDLRDFLKQIKLDSANKVKILLTSRRNETKWLGKIPHRIPMPRMRISDAARLALKLGEDKNLKRSEIADWQALLDYCSGNPLTLRVLVGQAAKAGLHGRQQIADFVESIRSGEQQIQDADEEQGRDKSLGASLDYGFRNAFKNDELPIIALLHLFQGTVDVDVLSHMGEISEHALPELEGKSKEYLIGLLDRAKDIGLLTHLAETWFTIHPALPWFLRQLFGRYYDGQQGRSAPKTALRSWVEAVAAHGNYYDHEFSEGNRGVIAILQLEEANLLGARSLARANGWLSPVIGCMQALQTLYEYEGRMAEWAKLVDEIRFDYSTNDYEPVPGQEYEYAFVMDYCMKLARDYEFDLAKAEALQEKSVKFCTERASAELALSADVSLDNWQRYRLRSLAVALQGLAHIQSASANSVCVETFKEVIGIIRRIGDKAGEAIAEWNLGNAYKDISSIYDLDAAEAAFQRSLNLHASGDYLGRSRCIRQIGMVHYLRLVQARKRGESAEQLLGHAHAAEEHLLQALKLCPTNALSDLAPPHNTLGNLYSDIGQLEQARQHYELDAHYEEEAGNRYGAGQTRFNVALMYAKAAGTEGEPFQQRASLVRARAYAEAALRDFQHYQGRVAKDEVDAQGLLDTINQVLAILP